MKYIAAYLLAQLGGNESPSSSDIKTILSSVGINAEQARLDKLISELKGKDMNEIMAAGAAKMASVPSGGSAPSSAPARSASPSGGKKEEKKVEKEEEKEESDDDMGMGLFD